MGRNQTEKMVLLFAGLVFPRPDLGEYFRRRFAGFTHQRVVDSCRAFAGKHRNGQFCIALPGAGRQCGGSARRGRVTGRADSGEVTHVPGSMDLVGYRQDVFDGIEKEYREFLGQFGAVPERIIPVSAKLGDNIANRGDGTGWYDGPTLIEACFEQDLQPLVDLILQQRQS